MLWLPVFPLVRRLLFWLRLSGVSVALFLMIRGGRLGMKCAGPRGVVMGLRCSLWLIRRMPGGIIGLIFVTLFCCLGWPWLVILIFLWLVGGLVLRLLWLCSFPLSGRLLGWSWIGRWWGCLGLPVSSFFCLWRRHLAVFLGLWPFLDLLVVY